MCTRRLTGMESCQVLAALRHLDSVDVVKNRNRAKVHITVVCQCEGEACRIPGLTVWVAGSFVTRTAGV